jgi:glycosyltransferase involved in cell wall biosynthesis
VKPLRRRTVLFVQPTSEVGGADLALSRLVAGLDKKAYRPIVALPGPGPLVDRIEASGGSVRFVPMPPLRRTLNPWTQGKFAAGFLPAVSALGRIIDGERVDLVHSNSLFTLYGGAAARRAGRPHVWHVRELLSRRGPVRAVFVELVRRWATEAIAMSAAVAGMLASGPRPVPSRVIPDGVDLEQFHPRVGGRRIRAELGVPQGAPLVTFIARLDPWKGLEVFLRAARLVREEVPEARFLVAGGPIPTHARYARRMKALAGDLGIASCTLFTDWRYRLDDIPEVLAASSLLVHASIEPEPFGLVLIEAMACGRPVVATAAGGVLDIVVDGETGLLVPRGDPEATARAAIRVLRDAPLASDLGRTGRERAEGQFGLKTCVGRVESVYRDILDGEAAA